MSAAQFSLGQWVHADDTLVRKHIWNSTTRLRRKEWRYHADHFDNITHARRSITGIIVGIRTLVDGRVVDTGDSIEFIGDHRRRAVQIVDALNHAPRLAWIEDAYLHPARLVSPEPAGENQ